MSNLDKARNLSGQKGKMGACLNHGKAFGGCWCDKLVNEAFCSVSVQYSRSWAVMGEALRDMVIKKSN